MAETAPAPGAPPGAAAGGLVPGVDAPGFLDDPYPHYHALRADNPVYQSPRGDWYLTRYADVAGVLTDQRFQRQSPHGETPISRGTRMPSVIDRMLSRWMVFTDPPLHTRLRGLVGTAFTPKRIAGLHDDIRGIAGRLLDEALEAERLDLIGAFAYPLPVMVISRILGVPAEDYGKLKVWSGQLTGALDTGDAEELATGIPATEELMAYVADLIAARRRTPQDDLVSAMLADSETEDALSDDELLANCVFLLWAGHETTKNLIGNGTLCLLRNPGEFTRLAENPGLLGSAVEEFLRYESPIQKIGRWTRRNVELGGNVIPAGSYVVSVFGAANRDPEQFPDPDRLDVGRHDGSNLAFGKGIHHCLGYGLAKLEAQVAFEALLRRVSAIELDAPAPRWQRNASIRGLESLPVAVTLR